ncbi:MAG: hypothetical protein KDA78_13150 [Planctomycetaceae bacterium]|nr:hypothetical protein [Planctomycetaceae bacterium]
MSNHVRLLRPESDRMIAPSWLASVGARRSHEKLALADAWTDGVIREADHINHMISAWLTGPHPWLICLYQQYSDQYCQADFRSLRNSFPLSRILIVLSEYCQSDARTRTLWPLSCQTSLAALEQRVQQEWHEYQDGTSPLPLTASYEEIAETRFSRSPNPQISASSLLLFSLDHSLLEAWRSFFPANQDICSLSNPLVFMQNLLDHHYSRIFIDLESLDDEQQQNFPTLSNLAGKPEITGFTSVPLPEQVSFWKSLGFTQVIDKLNTGFLTSPVSRPVLKTGGFPRHLPQEN